MTFPGLPATTLNGGTSLVITELAAITELLPSKYSGSPHITDKHMRFSPPPANASGGYTLI